MKNPIKVLLIENHLIARIGVAAIVNQQPEMTVIAEAGTGADGMRLFEQHRPDVTLMGLRLPDANGIEIISRLCADCSTAKIIALTALDGDAQITRALRAGARGYIFKNVLDDELINAIRLVETGKQYLCPAAAMVLSEHLTDEELTFSEQRILELIISGNSNKKIAFHLNVTESTVKTHVGKILEKLRVPDRTAAAVAALRRGIVH